MQPPEGLIGDEVMRRRLTRSAVLGELDVNLGPGRRPGVAGRERNTVLIYSGPAAQEPCHPAFWAGSLERLRGRGNPRPLSPHLQVHALVPQQHPVSQQPDVQPQVGSFFMVASCGAGAPPTEYTSPALVTFEMGRREVRTRIALELTESPYPRAFPFVPTGDCCAFRAPRNG